MADLCGTGGVERVVGLDTFEPGEDRFTTGAAELNHLIGQFSICQGIGHIGPIGTVNTVFRRISRNV